MSEEATVEGELEPKGAEATEQGADAQAPVNEAEVAGPVAEAAEGADAVGREAAEPSDEAAGAAPEAAEPADGAASATAEADDPAAEPEAEPVVAVRRQSIVLRSGACDLRVGPGVVDQVGQAAKTVAGKPGSVFVLSGDDVSAELLENVRRCLVDQGFTNLSGASVPAGRPSRHLSQASRVYDELAAAGLSADDPIVAVGDADVLSLAVFVGSTWQTGTSVVAVPTTFDGMVDVTVTPRSIDTGTSSQMLLARGNLRYAICDTELLPGTDDATSLMANAVMVAGAMAAGESNFSDLALRAEGIMARDAQTLVDEILDITKARTRVAASTALAMRQGVLYGLSVSRALAACLAEQDTSDARLAVETEVCEGRLLAEGLRISARLAAARQATDESVVDLVFAQDALLDKLGLSEVACNVNAERLISALRDEELSRSRRFMLALPLGYGRVRLNTVEDEMLAEHLGAWCRARKKLARRRAKAAAHASSAEAVAAAAPAADAPAAPVASEPAATEPAAQDEANA